MKKIGLIVGFLLCVMIVSTTAVSAAAPMDEDVKPLDGPCTAGEDSSSCSSDCGFEDDASNQDPTSYLIYFSS